MTEPTDNVSRLARIAKTMEAGHWHSSAKVVREAADEIERLRSERDEAIIRANVVIREASALITAKIPSGKASAYWNAVDQFRRTEAKTT